MVVVEVVVAVGGGEGTAVVVSEGVCCIAGVVADIEWVAVALTTHTEGADEGKEREDEKEIDSDDRKREEPWGRSC